MRELAIFGSLKKTNNYMLKSKQIFESISAFTEAELKIKKNKCIQMILSDAASIIQH